MTTRIPAMMHSAHTESKKTCACTGVRWCANCRDPRVRKRYRMDDPVSVPGFLSSRRAETRGSPGRIPDHPCDIASERADRDSLRTSARPCRRRSSWTQCAPNASSRGCGSSSLHLD